MKGWLSSPWASASFVAVLAAALYAQTFAHPFFYDDVFYVVRNPRIREFPALPHAFLAPFSPVAPGLYRPMAMLSYALDYAVAGLRPGWFHFSNVFLHALASGTFFLLLRQLLLLSSPAPLAAARVRGFALFGALVFAAHPVHTEAVAWVAGRSELLAGLLVFLSVLSFLAAGEHEGKRQTLLFVPSALLWFLALLSKEIALPLPLILLVLSFLSSKMKEEHYQYIDILIVRCRKWFVPFAVALALYLLLRFTALGGFSVPLEHVRTAGLTFSGRMALMVPVTAHYMKLMVLPVGLRLEYDWAAFPLWVTFLSDFVILGTVALGISFWRRGAVRMAWPARHVGTGGPGGWKVAALGIAWFFLFLIPVSNIIPIGELVAERFLYLPSAGFCLLLGALLQRATAQLPRFQVSGFRFHERCMLRTSHVSLLALLISFSLLTIQRNAEWRDPETLWRSTLALSPNAPHAAENLSALLLARGELAGAGELLERMLQRFPEKPMVQYLMAQWHLRQGERAEARPFLERALERAESRAIEFTDFQWGAVLLELERFEEALRHLERAAKANPYDPSLLNNVGVAQANLGRVEEAKASFARAVILFEEQGSLSEEERRNYEGAKANLKVLQVLP